MIIESIRVPILDGAPDWARTEVDEHSQLFTAQDAKAREERVNAAFAGAGCAFSQPQQAFLVSPLSWATNVEATLRLLDLGLDRDALADLDALAALGRVCQVVCERRGSGHQDLAEQLLRSTNWLLATRPEEWAELGVTWSAAMELLRKPLPERPWRSEDISTMIAAQPLVLTVYAAAAIGSNMPARVGTFSVHHTTVQWLARDLSALAGVTSAKRTIGPMSDFLSSPRDSSWTDRGRRRADIVIRELDRAAQALHNDLAEIELPAPVTGYCQTTLAFAGTVYQHVSNGELSWLLS